MTPPEYRQAAEDFRIIIGAEPLNGVLRTAALACEEARAALMRAGTGDDDLHRQLIAMQRKLEHEAKE